MIEITISNEDLLSNIIRKGLTKKIANASAIGINLIALKNSFTYVRKGGTVVLFGVPSKGEIIDIDMSNVYSKEITLVTTYAASDYDTKSALELISSGNIDVKSLITHKYSLDESMKAFQHAKSGDSAMKIIIEN